MNKHFAALLCAVVLLLGALSPPASAAQSKTHYPVSVEEYTEDGTNALRIKKVYQLSLSDDPAGIPTVSFERDGVTYELLDLTQKNEIGVDTQEYTETVTQDSNTGDMAAVLKQLDAQKDVVTDEGYSGILLLDHTTVNVKAKGYNTSTKNLSATRTYPNLSDADLSLVPKTTSDGGKTLTLNNVQWSNGEDGHFTATATYTGTVSSRYATGYVVTANYTGQVSKTDCEIVTYTAIFGAVRPSEPEPEIIPEAEPEKEQEAERTVEPEAEPVEQAKPEPEAAPNQTGMVALSIAGCAGGFASLIAAGIWCVVKMKERKDKP